jgi:hypothetical protein
METIDINQCTCSNCNFWEQRFPANKQLGVCKRMGVIIFNKRVSIIVLTDNNKGNETLDAPKGKI